MDHGQSQSIVKEHLDFYRKQETFDGIIRGERGRVSPCGDGQRTGFVLLPAFPVAKRVVHVLVY